AAGRERRAACALASQQRSAAAAAAGRFDAELGPAGELTRDEHPRSDTSAEKLAELRPAFRPDGTVTAGNSSGINDGAAAVVVASEDRAAELRLQPIGVYGGSGGPGGGPPPEGDRAR